MAISLTSTAYQETAKRDLTLLKARWTVQAFASFSKIRERWQALEDGAVHTPYQGFAWVEAWWTTIGQRDQIKPFLVVVQRDGQDVMVLPLGLKNAGGIVQCSFLGGKDANYAMPLLVWQKGVDLSAEDARDILSSIKRAAPEIDVFSFVNQPLTWNGNTNPFAQLKAQPSPSPSYRVDIFTPHQDFLLSRRSSASLKKLRKKAKAAEKAFGALRFERIDAHAKAFEAFFETFLDQRAERFQSFGVEDPYQSDMGRDFLRRLARAVDHQGRPVLEFHALYAGNALLASFGAISAAGHASVAVNSTAGGQAAKYSPGVLLLMHQLEHFGESGLASADYGIGDAPYKQDWCEADPLVDTILPASLKGHVASWLMSKTLLIKRALKQNRQIFGAIKALRAKRA